ncbi:MAG: urease accessory protein UreD [Pseudomonadota bacterium]
MNTLSKTDPFSDNKTGWQAKVDLEFKNRFGKSVLGECSRKGPLTFQRPFYPEDNVCHLYLLHPPGGIVGGDTIDLNIEVQADAHALITTPGAAKFYRSQGLTAYQQQYFHVQPTSVLEWFPQETILFPGAKADICTKVDLSDDAVFMGWEILCLGRPASRMSFDTGALKSKLSVYKNGTPLYIDQLCVDNDMDSIILRHCKPGLQDFPVSAVFVVAGIAPDIIFDMGNPPFCDPDQANTDSGLKGVTRINELMIARYLGHDPEAAKAYFISLWKTIRPVMLNRPACIPRIWAT